MTCWIIHWAFAVEQMEGQTHTRTCSLAVCTHLCAHAFICTLNMHIFKYSWTHTHTHKQTPSLHTPGGPLSSCLSPCCWHLGCFTSAPPLFPDTTIQPAHYQQKKKVTRTFISTLPAHQYWFHSFQLLLLFITLDLFSKRLYFKHNCQATRIPMQLYYSQIIDHSNQRSTVRVQLSQ